MTLEQPKLTREQVVQSDLGLQIARLTVENANARADIGELQEQITDLEGQLRDASDRA